MSRFWLLPLCLLQFSSAAATPTPPTPPDPRDSANILELSLPKWREDLEAAASALNAKETEGMCRKATALLNASFEEISGFVLTREKWDTVLAPDYQPRISIRGENLGRLLQVSSRIVEVCFLEIVDQAATKLEGEEEVKATMSWLSSAMILLLFPSKLLGIECDRLRATIKTPEDWELTSIVIGYTHVAVRVHRDLYRAWQGAPEDPEGRRQYSLTTLGTYLRMFANNYAWLGRAQEAEELNSFLSSDSK